MPRHRAVLVSAIMATVLPAFSVYAADPAPSAPPDTTGTLHPLPFRPAPDSQSAGLKLESEAASLPVFTFSRRDDHRRRGPASGAPAGSPLKLAPANAALRTGWQFSGRVGPVRWLTPLEGDDATRMRFGGRVPGQPRMPGLGRINIGVHYTFE